jgi:hypothetical protein
VKVGVRRVSLYLYRKTVADINYVEFNTGIEMTFFQQYFSYIVAVIFIGGGNRTTLSKPPTYQ